MDIYHKWNYEPFRVPETTKVSDEQMYTQNIPAKLKSATTVSKVEEIKPGE